jgi:hypothetical protein
MTLLFLATFAIALVEHVRARGWKRRAMHSEAQWAAALNYRLSVYPERVAPAVLVHLPSRGRA